MAADHTKKAPIAERARGMWLEILSKAGVPDNFLQNVGGPCPFCGGHDRFVFDDKGGSGSFHCRGCGAGYGMHFLARWRGKDINSSRDFFEVAKLVEELIGEVTPQSLELVKKRINFKASSQLTPEKIVANRSWNQKIIDETQDVVLDCPVWVYLHTRIPGMRFELIRKKVIRYHPALEYVQGSQEPEPGKKMGKWPAMIAVMYGPDGLVCNIHRTYLSLDGKSKAPVPMPKKMGLSTGVNNYFVPLAPPRDGELATAEGIETAFAVMVFRNVPCWPLLSTTGMKNFIAPQGVHTLLNFEDNDLPDEKGRRAGFEAGEKLKENNKEFGVRVLRYAPQKAGMDMLDLLVEMKSQH